MLTHGADVELEGDHHQHHDQGEHRIEVHGDHLDEGGDGALVGQTMSRHDAADEGDDVGPQEETGISTQTGAAVESSR